MIALPTSLSSVSGWQVVDWADPTFASPPAAGGLATIEFPQLPSTDMWLIDHMVASCTSATATAMRLYAGSPSPGNFRDGTDKGNFNVGDWPTGLLVRPSITVTAQWSGCSDGAIATITLQARVMRQVAG